MVEAGLCVVGREGVSPVRQQNGQTKCKAAVTQSGAVCESRATMTRATLWTGTTLVAIALTCSFITGATAADWLTTRVATPATVAAGADGSIVMSNGLMSRIFQVSPNWATIDFRDIETGPAGSPTDTSVLRAVKPEATVSLDGVEYDVGGLVQSGTYAYFNRTSETLSVNTTAFQYASHTVGSPEATMPWTPGYRHSPKNVNWPPLGVRLSISFKAPPAAPAAHQAITVTVVYEMYQGIPLVSKWLVINSTDAASTVVVTAVQPEVLAVNFNYGPVENGLLRAITDKAHGTQAGWRNDVELPASPGAKEPVLFSRYTLGPGVTVPLTTFRTMEYLLGNNDQERVGLVLRKVTRLLAPWTQENPIFFHLTPATDFRPAVDQLAEVGFEMIIYSFGSGFVFETANADYIAELKANVSYANAKGIEVGGYDLICLERGNGGYGGNVGDQWDRVLANGDFGMDACFASGWVDKLDGYFDTMLNTVGLTMVETDGPYGGQTCASTNHTHHHDNTDSVYMQQEIQGQLYIKLRARNVFINSPDNYFFSGSQKTGMGYNEDQYNLPRWQDLTVSRQGMFDDTYERLPTQGWMFVPLVDYHGGGAPAAFDPMSRNLEAFEWALAQYLGAGVAACYRGFRIFDAAPAKAIVTKWVSFYKTYRSTLIQDIIHVRRANGQDVDCFLHADPMSPTTTRGLAMVFNPASQAVNTTITLPLYYTGISTTAVVSEQGATGARMPLARDYSVTLSVSLPAKGITWFVIVTAD